MSATVITYDLNMSRWEPDARGRLERAAMELFLERGFEQTTVTEIAGRAGLTQRTFFRHFADKREVLFGGSGALQELLVSTLASAPESAAPIDAVAAALQAASAVLQERREYSRQRQAVIALSASSDSRMSCGRSRWPVSFCQRSIAILKTAIPISAARLAAGSVTPRWRSASASAADKDASLISSRS